MLTLIIGWRGLAIVLTMNIPRSYLPWYSWLIVCATYMAYDGINITRSLLQLRRARALARKKR